MTGDPTEASANPKALQTPLTPTPQTPRDATNWAAPVKKVSVQSVPSGAINLNMDGRALVGPLQGFGRLCISFK